jgi:hypothetical protein
MRGGGSSPVPRTSPINRKIPDTYTDSKTNTNDNTTQHRTHTTYAPIDTSPAYLSSRLFTSHLSCQNSPILTLPLLTCPDPKMALQLPNELILNIASNLSPPTRTLRQTQPSSALSSLSRCSTTLHSMLSPLLYSHLDLSQAQLLLLLNHPSSHFDTIKHLTLHSLWSDFEIDKTRSIALLESTQSERVVFPNATTLTLRDTANSTITFDPIPMLASLPKLLEVEILILDLRMLSWRLNGLPPLWPKSLRQIEMYCRNWTIPFVVPGIHHIIHMADTACPFRAEPDGADDDRNPDDESENSYRPLLNAAFRWIAMRIEACAYWRRKRARG